MSEFYGDSPSPPDIIVNIKDNISIENLVFLEDEYNKSKSKSKNKCFVTFLKNNISRIKAEKYLQILKNRTCKFKHYYKCLVEAYP